MGAAPTEAPAVASGRGLHGEGSRTVPASPEEVWAILLDPKELAALLPGCDALDMVGPNAYRAEVVVGIGPFAGVMAIVVAGLALPSGQQKTPVDDAALRSVESRSHDWLSYGRDYYEQRFSPLD